MIRNLLRIGRKGFCTSAAADAASKVASSQYIKPKWMKFFEGQEPIKIDLERSMKSDNIDLIQNYIKNNYLQFEDNQLVQVIPKVSRSAIIDRIKNEIRVRIIQNNFNLDVSQNFSLLEFMEEISQADRLLVLYTLTKCSESFKEYNHFQHYKIIQLAIKFNRLSIPLTLQFLDYFNENRELFAQPDQVKSLYLEKLDFVQFTQYILVLSNLKRLLVPEEFNSRITDETIRIISEIYIEKLSTFENNCENYYFIHLDKIFNPDVLKILPQDLKISYKKALVRILELKFDTETQLGKFSYFKNDRGSHQQKALAILRSIVQTNERELVGKILILIGNQIMSREISDFKFDFRLFSYMTKYQYAYKYYIDESFISMKSLLRSLIFNTKKFNEESEINAYHILLQKYKSYNELNYPSIIKQSEDFYSRKVDFSDTMVNQWNQLQKDIQQCLRDYINQQIASGFFTKLLYKIPSPIDKEEDEIIAQEDSEMDLLAIEEANEVITDAKEDDEELKKNGENIDESVSQEKLKDEDFKKQLGYKIIEFQSNLQQLKYVKTITYNSRIQFNQTVLLRNFINTIECVAQNLYLSEPDEEYIHSIKLLVKQDKLIEVFDHFCMIPSFLESLIMIEAYGKIKKGQSWLSPELSNKVLKIKYFIEDFFNKDQNYKDKTPAKYIKQIEQEINNLPTQSLPFDNAYDQHNFIYEIISNTFQVSNTLFEIEKQKTSVIAENKIVMQRKRDFLTEQFVYNKDNLLRKIVHSQIQSYFINESHLKKYTGEILFTISNQVQKNVVFYPFFADYVLPQKKIVIQILEKNRMIDGVENTISGFNQLNELYLKQIGYSVIYIDYNDFEIDFRSFQTNILKKLSKLINNN
ncbi:hypothetical protein ABPG72_018512 [Tetrahymena utriculariae]